LAEYRALAISQVAHELRTPLTSILGFAEIMLNQEQLNEAQRNFCERIQNSAQQLQANLTQLSDLSRLEAGKSDLRIEEFSLEDVVSGIARTVTAETRKSGIHLECKIDPDLPSIVSDRAKLRQTLRMLLEYVIARAKSEARIHLTVANSERSCLLRIGMDAGTSTPTTSTLLVKRDLGLAVAKYNLGLIGAIFTDTDRPGEGLDFAVQIPLHPSEKNSH
jgi:signal transduction histidine kinase